jgi:hypothetical protein
MLDLVINVDDETYAKLDKLDQDALRAWHEHSKQLAKHKGEKRGPKQQKIDLERVVNLYKIYGTGDNAIVNPASHPFHLTVKNRADAEKK